MRVAWGDDLAEHFAALTVLADLDDVPEGAVDTAKRTALDVLGAAIAGSRALGADLVRDQVLEWGGKPQSTIIASGERVPAQNAALVNGVYSHAVEYDDLHDTAHVHSFAVVLPAALAAAELVRDAGGKEFLTSLVIGAEIMCRLGLAQATERGWHGTSTYGVYGAAAAAARVLRLDASQTLNALGIASSLSAGTRQPAIDGGLTKRMHPGFAAQAGVSAALWAKRGITGSLHPFEGRYGHFSVYEDGLDFRQLVLDEIGRSFVMEGIRIKTFPACGYTHATLDAGLALLNRSDFAVSGVADIEVSVGAVAMNMVGAPYPPTAPGVAAAQFSIPYTLATLLRFGNLSLNHFTPKFLEDAETAELARKIRVHCDPSIPSRDAVPARLKVTMRDARTLEITVDHTRGGRDYPLTPIEARAKFDDCVAFAGRADLARNIDELADVVAGLERLVEVRDLTRLLS